MREYRRKQTERPKLKLTRDAEGRLRPSNDEEIHDIWAEQRRIRLAQAIEEDRRRAQKKVERRAKIAKLKNLKAPSGAQAREFVLNINFPKLGLPRGIVAKLRRLGKRRALFAVVAAVILIAGFAGYTLYDTSKSNEKLASSGPGGVLNAADAKGPQYHTVLPAGKNIEDLGGWRRVSPPGKEPVFAYADQIDGQVGITVSQQPLPSSFSKDPAGSLKDLAEQFGANEKLDANDRPAYVGTSIKGPQSVIYAIGNVLILIKSDSKLSNEQWVNYLSLLR